jgi:hypothetical protein
VGLVVVVVSAAAARADLPWVYSTRAPAHPYLRDADLRLARAVMVALALLVLLAWTFSRFWA